MQGNRGLMIVDDHELVRLGLRALIQSHTRGVSKPTQIFEARTLASALELYAVNRSDIELVFLDLGLPDTEGLSGLKAFCERFPSVSVVVLSGDSNPKTVQSAMAMGAKEYLKKTSDLSEVINYIQTHGVAMGASTGSYALSRADLPTMLMRGLTARQIQILDWILEGKSNREIGQLAFLAEGTVKNHVSTLLLHFGARSRSQLISSMR